MKEKILKLFYENSNINIKCEVSLLKYIDFCLNNNLSKKINNSEHHHILPKSKNLFPEYSNLRENPWNGVHLTYSNHYIAHSLLIDALNNQAVIYAWHRINKLSEQDSVGLIGPEKYSELRSKHKQLVVEYNKNRIITDETKQKMSDKNKNKVQAISLLTGERVYISKEEFDNDANFVGVTKGCVCVRDLRDNVMKTVTLEDYNKYDYYQHNTKGLVSAIDIRNRKRISVTKEEFDNDNNLVGMGAKEIKIYNEKGELYLQTALILLKKNYIFNIPLVYFINSAKNNREPISINPTTKSHESKFKNLGYYEYIGWYASVERY